MCPTIDKLQVNGSATSPASIKTAIDKVAAEDRSTVVVDISFGETVPMSVLFDVHATLRELKLWKVNYVVPEKEGVPMTLPRQSGSEQLKGIDSRYIATLSVNSKGVVALDETQIESDEVATLIKRRLDETSGLIISIEAANKTNYGDFLAVLTQVRDAGAPRIVIGGPTG
jgi:biopolymer transport protein ExbD